eukprot:12887857-Ditylum_brightwellii.AAC.1
MKKIRGKKLKALEISNGVARQLKKCKTYLSSFDNDVDITYTEILTKKKRKDLSAPMIVSSMKNHPISILTQNQIGKKELKRKRKLDGQHGMILRINLLRLLECNIPEVKADVTRKGDHSDMGRVVQDANNAERCTDGLSNDNEGNQEESDGEGGTCNGEMKL